MLAVLRLLRLPLQLSQLLSVAQLHVLVHVVPPVAAPLVAAPLVAAPLVAALPAAVPQRVVRPDAVLLAAVPLQVARPLPDGRAVWV